MRWCRALGLVALLGCTEPNYKPVIEAGSPACGAECGRAEGADGSLASIDASGSPSDAGDAQASDPSDALLGTYAVHARFYGRSLSTGFVRGLHELVVIADITRESGGLKMRVETCLDGGRLLTELGPGTDVSVKYPQYFPVRVFDLVYEAGTFYTKGEPLPIGYQVDPPPGCTPGAKIAARPDQPWLSGHMCTCPPNAGRSSPPPTNSDDCRVIDSDHDDMPGMTTESRGLINGEQYVRILDKSQYANGVVVPGTRRHYAHFVKDEDLLGLNCALGDCVTPGARSCAIEQQPASFVPLESGTGERISCEEVLRRKSQNEIFSGEPLDAFPADC